MNNNNSDNNVNNASNTSLILIDSKKELVEMDYTNIGIIPDFTSKTKLDKYVQKMLNPKNNQYLYSSHISMMAEAIDYIALTGRITDIYYDNTRKNGFILDKIIHMPGCFFLIKSYVLDSSPLPPHIAELDDMANEVAKCGSKPMERPMDYNTYKGLKKTLCDDDTKQIDGPVYYINSNNIIAVHKNIIKQNTINFDIYNTIFEMKGGNELVVSTNSNIVFFCGN